MQNIVSILMKIYMKKYLKKALPEGISAPHKKHLSLSLAVQTSTQISYSTKLWQEKTLVELELQENWRRKLVVDKTRSLFS